MEFTGQIVDVAHCFSPGHENEIHITFSMNERSAVMELDELKGKKLNIKASKYSEHRSVNANRLFWQCVGKMADKINCDKWSLYISLLRRYGQYTYVCVKPQAKELFKQQWREAEEMGEVEINGKKSVQFLCYFGSHTYNKEEFARLLNGTIQEMEDLGIQPPLPREVERNLEAWQSD